MSTFADVLAAAPSTRAMPDGYSLEADERGYYGSVRFWFSGADLQAFSTTVAGKPTTLNIGGVSVQRPIPLKHPYLDGGNCYASRIRIYAPDGVAAFDDGTMIGFPFYFADVQFATPEYAMEGGDYPTLTIACDVGCDRVTRPGSAYKFPSDQSRLNHDVGVRVHTIEYEFTCHKLPKLSLDLYEELVDTVNESEFLGKPPGTLMYKGPRCTGQYVVAGLPTFDVTHSFSYRSIPHNQIMRPDGTKFEAPIEAARASSEPGGSSDDEQSEEDVEDPIYLYPEGDHSKLLGF